MARVRVLKSSVGRIVNGKFVTGSVKPKRKKKRNAPKRKKRTTKSVAKKRPAKRKRKKSTVKRKRR